MRIVAPMRARGEHARLHDLRDAHGSQAVTNAESLHVAGRLPGNRRASTANRYGICSPSSGGEERSGACRIILTSTLLGKNSRAHCTQPEPDLHGRNTTPPLQTETDRSNLERP